MSLGVLTNIAAIYAENNLNQTQSSLQNTLTQLSSGSRINSGADDAAGLSVVDGLQANVSALTQSSQNASDGIGLLQTADGALSQVTNLLNRAVTLATEAANGTLNTNQVSSANAEYQNILTEIGNIGSTTNFNGNSVFTSTAKTVFVSDGTASGATSFSETVGSLSDSSVGQSGSGLSTLAVPTTSAPVATTTLQSSVAVTSANVTTVPLLPTSSAPTGTSSTQATTALTTGANITTSAGSSAITNSTGGSYTAITGATSSNGTPYVASTLTGSVAGAAADDTYTGTIEVQAGSNALVTTTFSSATSLTDVVNTLNQNFGYNPTTSSYGASGLKASDVNNELVLTSAPGAGTVVVASPVDTFTLTGSVANTTGTAVTFNNASGASAGTVNAGFVANTQTTGVASSTTITLGTGALEGTLDINSGGAGGVGGSTVGTIAFGNGTLGATAIGAAVTTAFATGGTLANAGYSGSYNSTTGVLTVNGPSTGSTVTATTAAGPNTLESGTVTTTTTTPATSGVQTLSTSSAAADTLYTGTINYGTVGTTTAGSYTIASGGQTASQIAAALNTSTYLGASGSTTGIQASVVNNELTFSGPSTGSAGGTSPAVTLTGVSATPPPVVSYSASISAIAPTNTDGTFSGTLSVGVGSGTQAVTTIASATSLSSLVSQLNTQYTAAGNNIVASAGTGSQAGDLILTGPTPANGASAQTAAADQLTFGSATDLTVNSSATATIGNSNAVAGTLYTGTISYGASGTTSAGSYQIASGGQTAAQIVAALNTANNLGASGTTTGLQASVNTNNQITFSGPSTGSSAGSSPAITLTNLIATAPSVTSYTQSTAAFAAGNTSGTFSGTLSVGTVGGSLTSTTIAAGTTLSNLVTQLNNQYLTAGNGIVASAGTGSSAGELILTAPQTANGASSTVAANNQLSFGSTTSLVASGGTTSGVDFSATNISTLTASSAQTVLTSVTTAINDVAYQRGLIGADVNELTAASNVASAESVNLTSAQSSIQSTDYGAATSNLAKYQVLSQTGISALAQANSVSQEVLKLLQ
jgi:flagellin